MASFLSGTGSICNYTTPTPQIFVVLKCCSGIRSKTVLHIKQDVYLKLPRIRMLSFQVARSKGIGLRISENTPIDRHYSAYNIAYKAGLSVLQGTRAYDGNE